MYYRARHYSPRLGRFGQKDPSDPEHEHYVYADCNPAGNIDPLGLETIVILDPSVKDKPAPKDIRTQIIKSVKSKNMQIDGTGKHPYEQRPTDTVVELGIMSGNAGDDAKLKAEYRVRLVELPSVASGDVGAAMKQLNDILMKATPDDAVVFFSDSTGLSGTTCDANTLQGIGVAGVSVTPDDFVGRIRTTKAESFSLNLCWGNVIGVQLGNIMGTKVYTDDNAYEGIDFGVRLSGTTINKVVDNPDGSTEYHRSYKTIGRERPLQLEHEDPLPKGETHKPHPTERPKHE